MFCLNFICIYIIKCIRIPVSLIHCYYPLFFIHFSLFFCFLTFNFLLPTVTYILYQHYFIFCLCNFVIAICLCFFVLQLYFLYVSLTSIFHPTYYIMAFYPSDTNLYPQTKSILAQKRKKLNLVTNRLKFSLLLFISIY